MGSVRPTGEDYHAQVAPEAQCHTLIPVVVDVV